MGLIDIAINILEPAADAIIAALSIYFLQETFTKKSFVEKYPVFDNYFFRFALAVVAAGFTIDFFSVVSARASGIVTHIGLSALMIYFFIRDRRASAAERAPTDIFSKNGVHASNNGKKMEYSERKQ